VTGPANELLGWRSVLFAAVPVALTADLLPASVAASPGSSGTRHRADPPAPAAAGSGGSGTRHRLDLPGAVTVTGVLAALLYALSQARTAGWTAPLTLAPWPPGCSAPPSSWAPPAAWACRRRGRRPR
jgi:hypothetical protein